MEARRSKGQKCIIINDFKVFAGQPIVSKKTITIDKNNELKNNKKLKLLMWRINLLLLKTIG